jgi:hypothetical protein
MFSSFDVVLSDSRWLGIVFFLILLLYLWACVVLGGCTAAKVAASALNVLWNHKCGWNCLFPGNYSLRKPQTGKSPVHIVAHLIP